MRERSRKSLSVLLSVILAMSCFSVLFALTPSALTADEAKAELLAAFEAIPPGELDAYAFTPAAQGGHSSSSGTMPMSIVDNTSNGSIYDAAVAFADYLATDAMKLGTGTLAADENTNYW